MRRLRVGLRPALALLASAILSSCGGNGEDEAAPSKPATQAKARTAALAAAANVDVSHFPRADGRSLQQLASTAGAGPNLGLAVAELQVGTSRLGFGMIDDGGRVVYGPTVVYVARSPNGRARGPFPAPADTLLTEPKYRSRFAATQKDPFAAIYSAEVPFRQPGRHAVLALMRRGGQLVGSTTEVDVARDSALPEVGERAPRIHTDTLASANGNISAVETRIPPDDMHEVDFADVVGRRPVALLFATPALCESRTCGPVTDILLQLKQTYGDRMAFIHQEVYVDNDPNKGYRRPLREFKLRSEPWLFTVDRRGRIAARLEGAFGLESARSALEAALH